MFSLRGDGISVTSKGSPRVSERNGRVSVERADDRQRLAK